MNKLDLHHLFPKAFINSYADAEREFSRCKDKNRGRPLRGTFRLTKDANDYIISRVSWKEKLKPLLRIHPDNTVTFVAPVDIVVAYPFSFTLPAIIPLGLDRVSTNKYRVYHGQTIVDCPKQAWTHRYSWWYREGKRSAQEYFQGVRFDLTTGKCLNPMPDRCTRIIPERRKLWLQDKAKLMQMVKTWLKLGVLVGAPPFYQTSANNYKSAVSYIYESMVNHDYSRELQIVLASLIGHHGYDADLKMINKFIDNNSVALREMYGVFDDSASIQEAERTAA